MEKTFLKLQQGWRARFFQVDLFSCPVRQHHELQDGFTETEKLTEGAVSNLPSQPSSNDSGFIIIGENSCCKPAQPELLHLLSYQGKCVNTILCSQVGFPFVQVWKYSLQR